MKKYENFCNAFRNLKDIYEYEEPYSNVEMSGLVKRFWSNRALQRKKRVHRKMF